MKTLLTISFPQSADPADASLPGRLTGLRLPPLAAVVLLLAALCAGCKSSDSGGSASVHTSVYYGVGWYDPWYYGPGYYPPDVIVTPPPRPEQGPHPEQPIAKPPPTPTPAPRPMPSIPSTPRPMPRPMMRR